MESLILWAYSRLYAAFGPQGWWPLTPPGKINPVHRPENTTKHLTTRDKSEIMIGSMLTQNTAWRNVETALSKLNEKGLMDFSQISKTRHSILASCIRSAGYFNQKSMRLKGIARYVRKSYKGNLFSLEKKPLGDLRNELLALKGIGPETADSMMLYAFGKPSFVIDAYTRRVFGRVGLIQERDSYDSIKAIFERHLPHDPVIFKEYHALIVELAKRNCTKKPACLSCPLKGKCNYFSLREGP